MGALHERTLRPFLLTLTCFLSQPSAIASDERHLNTAPQTPEPQSDGEYELGEDELMDEDDMAKGTVSLPGLPRQLAGPIHRSADSFFSPK